MCVHICTNLYTLIGYIQDVKLRCETKDVKFYSSSTIIYNFSTPPRDGQNVSR